MPARRGQSRLELGLSLGEGWRDGRDKVCIAESAAGFGLWAEQLLAESTGKQGKGLVPAPGEPADGPDRQAQEVRLPDEYELGAGVLPLGVRDRGRRLDPRASTRSTSPTCRRRRTRRARCSPPARSRQWSPRGRSRSCSRRPAWRLRLRSRRSSNPTAEAEEKLALVAQRARETGCVVTHGYGPRYLHSTGQLHKGGPPTGLFLQVVDDTGDELAIPGQPFGFGRLIRAQAAGDFASLQGARPPRRACPTGGASRCSSA